MLCSDAVELHGVDRALLNAVCQRAAWRSARDMALAGAVGSAACPGVPELMPAPTVQRILKAAAQT